MCLLICAYCVCCIGINNSCNKNGRSCLHLAFYVAVCKEEQYNFEMEPVAFHN